MQESDDLEFTPSDFPLGAIIGTVEIFAVVSAGFRTDNQIDREVRSKLEAAGFDPSCGAIRSGWKHISYAEQMILVRNPIRFEEPIPHKGALNFWRPKRDSAVASGTHEQP